jgi:terminase small subunit / prophage DNA-packing protein
MTNTTKNKVNRSDLAVVFGVAPTTVDAWVKAGCPYDSRATGRGKGWVFDTADVSRWREQRAADEAAGADVQDEAALKKRKLSAEAKTAEMVLLKEMGSLAPVDAMERIWCRVMAELQSNLRGSFVTRCASQLIGETDERAFKRILLAEVDSSLECLSEMDLSEGEDVGVGVDDGDN